MPKIQAYKGDGKIIPKDAAKLSTAYRCPWTGSVMGDKRSYIAYLKKLRKTRMHRQIMEKRLQGLSESLWSQPDFDKVIKWIDYHPEFMYEMIRRNNWNNDDEPYKPMPKGFIFKITYLNLWYVDLASNSHSAPRGGVQNFDRRAHPDRPTGYPGMVGNICFSVTNKVDLFGSQAMKKLSICIGTGGGAGFDKDMDHYHYDVKFFLSDWPEIAKDIGEARTMAGIKGEQFNFTYTYGKDEQ